MKRTYPVYVILTLVIFASGIFLAGSRYHVFLDIPSMAIVFLPLTFMLLTVYKPSEMADAFKCAMKGADPSLPELKKACLFFEGAQQLLYKIAFIATLFGIILMLSARWKAEDIGQGFSVAILTVLYALFAGVLVIVPFKTAVKKRIIEMEDR